MTTATKPSAAQTAQAILDAAAEAGFTVTAHYDVVQITKSFIPGDNAAFVEADGSYWHVLTLVPQTGPGSVYGTDGSGMGAVEAMRTGVFRMTATGCSKRVVAQLAKLGAGVER